MKKRRLVEESDSEEYLHKAAWSVVLRQIEHAKTNPAGCLYDYLVAMVFSFHCIEGYLNFVGEKAVPELWADERARFGKRGLTGKLEVICERCGVPVPPKGKRPYATVAELKELRDKMAHPKTHRITGKRVEFVEGEYRSLFAPSYLSTLVSRQKALRARDDVKSMADTIHAAAVRQFPHVHFGPDALDGIQGMRTTSVRLLKTP